MTKRLIVAMVATVVTTLLFVGVGTLGLAAIGNRRATRNELQRQAVDLIAAVDANGTARGSLLAIQRLLRLEDAYVLQIDPTTRRITGALATKVTICDADETRLLAGQPINGMQGRLAWAAAPRAFPTGITGRGGPTVAVAVVTRKSLTGLGPAGRWFTLASLITVALATALAVVLGRRLGRPIHEARLATARIASGDLAARLPEPTPDKTDEVSELARSINTMASTLERSKGLEQQFLMSVSHDLRTPLTSIRGYAEAITDGATKDPAWAAGVILTESRRLERLVGDLLDLAKLESRSFSLRMERLDLSLLANRAAEALRPEAADAGIEIVAVTGPAVPVFADGDRLGQVIANLVENAVKYARQRVAVTAASDGSSAVLWVDDDGPGIAPGDLAFVFERLYVARHEPARKEVGSGLGLAIVRELTLAMGGTVAAEVGPHGGARMVVRFPSAGASQLPPPR